jgi:short-subunit dehydrogenase
MAGLDLAGEANHSEGLHMSTIAIIGAGPGLGAASARRFAREGYKVALISRKVEKVESMARDLTNAGHTARGYAASVRDRDSLVSALVRAAQDLGPIEVLQYSPVPQPSFMRPVLETNAVNLSGAIEFSIYGSVAATLQVLDGMRSLGTGTILFVNGSSAVRPNPAVAGTSIAFAGESAYAQMLHDQLAGENIHVGQLIIPGAITPGHPKNDPDALAARLWTMHAERGDFRQFAEALDND